MLKDDAVTASGQTFDSKVTDSIGLHGEHACHCFGKRDPNNRAGK